MAGLGLLVGAALNIVGFALYAPIGAAVTSNSTGDVALRRIAETGNRLAIVNAIFHLGPLLLLPAIAALFVDLSPVRPAEVIIGSLLGLVAFAVPIAVIFPMTVALSRMGQAYATADAEQRARLATAADANLATQAGGEFIQTGIGGLWALAISAAMLAAPGWPAWVGALGLVGGAGTVSAGFASLFARVPTLGKTLGAAGGLGLVALQLWLVAVGWTLLTAA